MVDAATVSPDMLGLISYGEERPATMDIDKLELNRRVEVKCGVSVGYNHIDSRSIAFQHMARVK